MAEDVYVAVVGSDPEVQGLWPIPLIVNGIDEERGIAEPELDRPLVGFVAGITFDAPPPLSNGQCPVDSLMSSA